MHRSYRFSVVAWRSEPPSALRGSGDTGTSRVATSSSPSPPLTISVATVSPLSKSRTLPLESMDPVFHAAADATEEAIVNALCAAETMTGRAGHTAPALPLDLLVEVMGKYRS